MHNKIIIALLLIGAATSASQPAMTDSVFLDLVQRASFDFFWQEANPSNGLIKDRSTSGSPCSIASVGFGLSAIAVAIDHGWITRDAGRQRVLTTLKTFWQKPQGRDPQGYIGYKGFFYHFLYMDAATRLYEQNWKSELSSIDTALLLAGILDAKQYFANADSTETQVRALADSIYYRVDWNWMRNFQPNITLGWSPETGYINAWWRGYNEAMIMCILGIGSPTHPVPASTWTAWTSGYEWQTQFGQSYVIFPPLFGHQYSHCWIDFRNIQDDYMRQQGITYFENSRRATLVQRAYCMAHPEKGYNQNVWGITACDGPNGYFARGAPPILPANPDDGTIAPTAAASSIPFTPQESLAAMRHMYDTYRDKIWMKYGFRDAFNLTVNWWDTDVIGIDEGPIVMMIENYRTQSIWKRFMQNPDIQRGLQAAGFTTITGVEEKSVAVPSQFSLSQNYPNPFSASGTFGNPTTTIRFTLPQREQVTLKVFDTLGNEVASLMDSVLNSGEHKVVFAAGEMASGIYFIHLTAGRFSQIRKAVLMK